jgi:hypothetical protein
VTRRVRAALAVAVLGLVAVLAAAGTAAGSSSDPLSRAGRAADRLDTIDRAAEAGYAQFLGCVHEPGMGAMGMHFVNGTLVGDGVLDVDHPEAVMFEHRSFGHVAVLGVEYIVPQSLWDAAHSSPPSLFGRTLKLIPEPNRYGIPPFYEIHAWTEKANPAGDHADFNPRVVCPAAPDRAPAS